MWFCTLVGGIVWIKCRQFGKCPVSGFEKLCKEYTRLPSKFSVFGDSAFDCESKNLPRYMNRANLPGRAIVDPSGAFL